MIERVNQTIEVTKPLSFSYNFARGSLLEYSYRIKPILSGIIGVFNVQAYLDGMQITFGVGSPPDFGLGTTQTQTLLLPPQIAPQWSYELELASLSQKISAAKAKIVATEEKITLASGQAFWLKLQVEKAVGESTEERALRQQLEAAEKEKLFLEGEVATIKREIANIEFEKFITEGGQPSGWVPSVSGSFPRVFDALRFSMLGTTSGLRFIFEHTIEVARPEDIGPTYTTPFQGR
jgi:hypothetical protein